MRLRVRAGVCATLKQIDVLAYNVFEVSLYTGLSCVDSFNYCESNNICFLVAFKEVNTVLQTALKN